MDLALAVIGSPLLLEQLLRHTLKLTLAAGGQVAALGPGGRVFVQEGGNLQFVPDTLGHALGELHALLHSDVLGLGNKGDDVGGTHALVLTLVLVHVDALGGDLGQLEGNLFNGVDVADQSKYAAVVIAVGLGVKQSTAGDAVGCLDQRVIGSFVLLLAAAEVGDTLYKLRHDKFLHYFFDDFRNGSGVTCERLLSQTTRNVFLWFHFSSERLVRK